MKRFTRIVFALLVVVVGAVAAGIAILKSLDFNSYRGVIAEEAEKAIGRKLTIAGDLKLDISFTPSLTVEGVSLANAAWGSRPQMATVKRFSAQVELWPLLSGEARVTRVELTGVDALLETNAKGQANWQFAGAGGASAAPAAPAAAGGRPPIVPVIGEVVVKDAKVAYREAGGPPIEVGIDELTAASDGLQAPIRVALKGRVGGAAVAVNGKLGPLALLLAGEGSYPAALTVKAFGAEASVDGALQRKAGVPAPDFAVTVKTQDLAATVKAAAAALPALAGARAPAMPLDVAARLLASGKGYGLEAIRATLGVSDLGGRVAFETAANGRPRVTADLASKRLNVAALLAAMPPAQAAGSSPSPAPAGAGGAQGRLFSADPLPLEALRAVDAKAALKVDAVVLPAGVELANAAIDILLDKGRLKVAPLAAGLAGGTITGAVNLDASGPKAALDVRLDADAISAGKLAAQLKGSELVQGAPTGVALRLNGKGASLRELMAGLDGETTVTVGEGRIHNKALDLAGADVVMQLLNALNPQAAKEDYTVLSCGVVRFLVKDGIAKADRGIAVETDKVNVVGSGTVDLRDEKLDLAVKPEAKEGLGLNLGALAGLVRVQGPLADPSVGVDKAGAAKAAVSIGAALATGGLSVLGQSLMDKSSQDPHPCQTALGKAPAKAAEPAPAKPAAPADSGSPKDTLRGVGKALEGLFGGKK